MIEKIYPKKLRIESSSECQLNCRCCENGRRGEYKSIKRGFLRVDDFSRVIEENRNLHSIELSNYGEVFLNPFIEEIVEIAGKRKVRLTATNGSNLNYLPDSLIEKLVLYQFEKITCSIDGASEETYKKYRVGGNYNKVINNIRKINACKERFGTRYPELRWQFIVFGHNEHEIPRAREMADELDMLFFVKYSWDKRFSPIRNEEKVRRDILYYTTPEFLSLNDMEGKNNICSQLWDEPQINWNGSVLGCCVNHWGEFDGNVFDDGLERCLNSEKMNYARLMLQGLIRTRHDIPCAKCNIYKNRKKKREWLRR